MGEDDGKHDKAAVNYSLGQRDKCRDCRYFIVLMPQWTKGKCHKVKGPIDDKYWCREFARA